MIYVKLTILHIVPSGGAVLSKDELRELVLSWQIKEAVRLAMEDSDVLLMLLDLVREDDVNTKVRALLALYEVLKGEDGETKLLVINEGFDAIISALKSKEPRLVTKSLKVLSALVEGFPLRKEEFLKLVDILVELVKDPGMEFASIEMAELVTKLTVAQPSPAVRSKVAWLISSDNPRLKGMGLRLLLNIFVFTGDPKSFKTLLEGASELLLSDDDILVDFVLDVLAEALQRGVPEDAMKVLPRVLSRVKRIVARSDDFFIRSKAKRLARMGEEALYNYYRSRPEEAKNTLHRLVLNGEYSTAMDLAISLGDEFLIKWLSKTLEKEGVEEFTPRVQVVGGPRGGSAGVVEFSPPAPSERQRKPAGITVEKFSDVESIPSLERVIEEGDAEALLDILRSRPDSVREIERFLRSGDPGKRSNALWTLSRLVNRMNNGEFELLYPLIPTFFDVADSGNPWERNKGAKILAILASKGGRQDILEKMLSLLPEHPVPALEFFSYYFIYTWDEEAVSRVLRFLKGALSNHELQFSALMVLDAVTMWGIRPEIDRESFLPILEGLINSDDDEIRKVARRVMERFKTA
ncbi:hypothetical protein [Thermococcus thioreducens]|uniref:HEAT repeat domain-containing protein n=1 Tax=Thermococcus thioreducens TaxID=277988 RepID=A0A1I0PMG2_9EURY|nr:hypothetical protein [Thermococcus thioreducens]SEW15607.1 hypothetical protein SAMN05216170_1934 [Thermococcus thioreducens]